MRIVTLVVVLLLLAGCVGSPADDDGAADGPASASEIRVGGALLHAGGTAGAFAIVHLAEGDGAEVTFPADVLVLDDEGRLVPGGSPMPIAQGKFARFLAPYGASSVNATVAAGGESREIEIALVPGRAIASGDLAVELLKVQRDRFQHRTPGHENYSASIAYFGESFAALGYEVETFATPLPDIAPPVPILNGVRPESLKSVLGYKRGTDMADRYIVFGGHFDVVEQVTHGALDNTAGTVATLALAQAFANITTRHTLIFAAWGGEEDGILGSQAWLTAHPELVPAIDLYVNYDVTGIAWPAPATDPAPVVFTSGPDGPIGDALAAQHQTVLTEWMKLDAPFVYEPVAQGQAAGGVNAQSDHTPFLSRGIPAAFQYTSRLSDAFLFVHQETDTVENLTAYSLLGPEGVGMELNATQRREGEALLARSFETQMMGGFYLAALLDAGVLSPARPAPPGSLPTLENARS